jgi:hypothetical protein
MRFLVPEWYGSSYTLSPFSRAMSARGCMRGETSLPVPMAA